MYRYLMILCISCLLLSGCLSEIEYEFCGEEALISFVCYENGYKYLEMDISILSNIEEYALCDMAYVMGEYDKEMGVDSRGKIMYNDIHKSCIK